MIASTYGWTHDEILNLTYSQFRMYYQQSIKLAARSQILMLQASSYPYMEMPARMNVLKGLNRLTTEHIKPQKEVINETWAFLRKLRGL